MGDASPRHTPSRPPVNDPIASHASRFDTSSPRARTLQRLRALLGPAAALAAACGPDHRRAPPNTDDFGPPRDPSATTTAPKTTTTPTTHTRPHPPPSYAVVDPMPAPGRCASSAQARIGQPTVVFAGDPLEAVLQLSPAPDGLTAADVSRITGKPGRPAPRAKFVPGGLEIRLTPEAGAHELYVEVPVTCGAGTGPDNAGELRVYIAWSGDAAVGVTPRVNVYANPAY